MKNKKVPQLRFRGFEDEWEEKKLGEVSDRVTRTNENLDSKLPLTISAQYGLVDQITFFNNQVASVTNLKNYFLLEKGEFAYNKSYSAGYPWGAIKRLDRYEKGVRRFRERLRTAREEKENCDEKNPGDPACCGHAVGTVCLR